MATLAATMIIHQNLGLSDAELLKRLRLDRKARQQDNHKIGRAKVHYHNALTIRDEVFITSFKDYTIIVSEDIPSDFVGGGGTLKNAVFKLFPTAPKIAFFSNSTSMLNGFIVFDEQKRIRSKIVQDGKVEKLFGDALDSGVFLPEEITFYESKNVATTVIKENYDYIWGLHDLEIAMDYVKRVFKWANVDQDLETLIFNKYEAHEISQAELQLSQEKLTIKAIHQTSLDFILSKFPTAKKLPTSDNYPSVSRKYKYEVPYENFNVRIIVETNLNQGLANSKIDLYLLPKEGNLEIYNFEFLNSETGLNYLNIFSHELLLSEDHDGRITNSIDLRKYVNCLNQLDDQIFNRLADATIEQIFIDFNNQHYLDTFEKLQSHSKRKGWIQGYEGLKIILAVIFYRKKAGLDIKTEAQAFHDFLTNFEVTVPTFEKGHHKKVEKYTAILNKISGAT